MKARIVALGVGLGMLLATLVSGIALASAASAQPNTYTGGNEPQVGTPTGPGEPTAPGEPVSTASGSHGALAFTGGDIAGMAIVGIVCIGVGGTLVYRSRLRRHNPAA